MKANNLQLCISVLYTINILLINIPLSQAQGITFSLHTLNLSNDDFIFRNLYTESIIGGSSTINYYYTYLYVGSPPQKQSYIIDTGSHITTSPCDPYCKQCGKHQHKYYRPARNAQPLHCNDSKCGMLYSQCNTNSQCSFSISYSEGSTLNGLFFDEVIQFGEPFPSTRFPIGCTTSETQLFKTQLADGIMGLSNSNNTLPDILHKNGVLKNNLFTLCLSQTSGYFSLGEVNTTLHKTDEISYIPITKGSEFYTVSLDSILINENMIFIDKNLISTVIDSGSTLTYFPEKIIRKIEDAFTVFCADSSCGIMFYQKDFSLCFEFNTKQEMTKALNFFPNITFTFTNGAQYIWEPADYIYHKAFQYHNEDRKICLGFNQGNNLYRINLGSTWMHNQDIIFNKERQQIGFVKANCGLINNNNNDKKANDNNNFIHYIREGVSYDTNEETSKYSIIYGIITTIMLCIIIFLSIALYHISQGRNFLFFRIAYDFPQDKFIFNTNEIPRETARF